MESFKNKKYRWVYSQPSKFWHSIEIFDLDGELIFGMGCGEKKRTPRGTPSNPEVVDAIRYIETQNGGF